MAASTQQGGKIDALMEQASSALVDRQYFDVERLCLSALRKSHRSGDYERLSRIILPLQEARRQIRDLAFDAGKAGAVFVVDDHIPVGRALVAGCYLVQPPRVGVDGRILRETAAKRGIPTIVTVREPVTQDGLWPLVSVGPVTVRTKVAPPSLAPARAARTGRATAGAAAPEAPGARGRKAVVVPSPPLPKPPPAEWFIRANEALGDAAIASLLPHLTIHAQVDALIERLEAMADHEKLHQRLHAAARDAGRTPIKTGAKRRLLFEDEGDEG